jgi:hypothetical protein
MKKFKRVFERDLSNLIFLEKSFEVKKSNTTYQISVNGNKTIYSDERMNPKIFSVYRNLEKELSNSLDFFKKDEKEVGYFLYGKSDFEGKVFNIDISSAYLTVLFNTKLISKNIFLEISNMKKKDRLKILGMLAYQPYFFYYEKGILFSQTQRKNDFRNVFFYCVKETFKIMKIIKKKLGNDFIFSWVDGVYFQGERNINLVCDILRTKKLKFTVERLPYFSARKSDELTFYCYEKFSHSKGKFEQKNICVPDNNFQRILYAAFNFNEAMQKKDEVGMQNCLDEYLKNRYL